MTNMEEYKVEFKLKIEEFINEGNLEVAKKLISDYEDIVGFEDIEIISMKAVILIIENDIENARKILIKAINNIGYEFDLVYNLAHCYNECNEYSKAFYYYSIAKEKCNCEEVKNEITELLEMLSTNNEIEDIKEKKHVLMIAHIFPPLGGSGVQRTLKYSKYIRNYGWEPIVVTVGNTRVGYLKDETLYEEVPSKLEVIRFDEDLDINVKTIDNLMKKFNLIVNDKSIMLEYKKIIDELIKENKLDRLLNSLMIPDNNILWALDVLEVIDEYVDFNIVDILYSTSGPYSDHLIGYFLKEKYKKLWVCDFRDEWTNNCYADYDKENLFYKIIYNMEKNILLKSDRVITTTPMATENYIRLFGVPRSKIYTITNGYDEADFEKLQVDKSKNEKFTIVHNGLLYMIRTPETFIRAIKELVDNNMIPKSDLKIIFSYTANVDKWRQYVCKNNLEECIIFSDYMTHEESLQLSINSDLLLLIVGPGEKNKSMYPGKIFEYLRMGRKVLSLSPKDSIVEKLINETDSGENYEFDDVKGIKKSIYSSFVQWKGSLSKDVCIDEKKILRYERRALTKELASILDLVVSEMQVDLDLEVKDFFLNKEYEKILNWILSNYFKKEKYKEVLKVCEFWNENINSEIGMIYFVLGYIYNHLGRFNEAYYYHRLSLKLDKSLADIKYREALCKEHYNEEQVSCIGCESNDYEIVNVVNQSLIETNLGIVNPLRVWVKCKKCGLIYTNPMTNEEDMNLYYSEISKERRAGGKYGDVENKIEFLISMSNKRLEKLENVYRKKGRLLDIGTGIGTFVGVAKERGWNAEGLEFNRYDCEFAKNKFGLDLLQEDFYDFSQDRVYDVVTLFEVIEHLSHPLKDLKKINKLVKDDGMLVLATPIVDSLHGKREGLNAANWYVVTHLSYFSFEVLNNYLHESGFEIIEVNYSPEGYGRLEFYCAKIKSV